MGTPIVHLNGTSRDALIDGRMAVVNALEEARKHLRSAWPHARDYYIAPDYPSNLRAAESKWQRIHDAIVDLELELEEEVEKLFEK